MSRIIKGYWRCKYCGIEDIDGLVDRCPNCGKQKSEDVKYYLKGEKIEVTDEELEKAGISREECNGEHKDWVCSYCNQLNNWSDDTCVACGASKSESEYEYGMQKVGRADDEGSNPFTDQSEIAADVSVSMYGNMTVDDVPQHGSRIERFFQLYKQLIFGIAVLIPVIAVLVFLLWPVKEQISITGFGWERNISIEEEKTFNESGWTVPAGARVYDEKWEFKEYVTVIDHYETVYETRSRQVFSHYETDTYYTDNGNGTFTEHTTQTPVYVTEYYEEPVQEPVYRQDPVYDTKYYYEIDRWVETDEYPSSGEDHEPYWNEDYTLAENERDTLRTEEYFYYFSDGSTDTPSYAEWAEASIGDGYEITRCRLGLTYDIVPLEAVD